MKTALITTTINVPYVLALYRKYGPDVAFFVAGDQKSPHEAICELAATRVNGNFLYMSPDFQDDWKCSELIGWNCIQRRNIALLEAIKWEADAIITIDDDVIALNNQYFVDYQTLLSDLPKSVIQIGSANGWIDPGQLLTPTVQHRGIPAASHKSLQLSTITDARIGVAAGLWVGDADVDATHRIANPPAVYAATALAEAGVVADPRQWTVWNAQNVGFIRELAPCMFQAPGIGRADDIWASLITQRIMREHNLHTHIGKPFTACWQERSKASMIRDLEEELLLYKHTADLAAWLDDFVFEPGVESVLEQTRYIYKHLDGVLWYPERARAAALAFCDDVEGVL